MKCCSGFVKGSKINTDSFVSLLHKLKRAFHTLKLRFHKTTGKFCLRNKMFAPKQNLHFMKKLLLLVSCVITVMAQGQIPTNGLITYYTFNNGLGIDSSGNGFHATVQQTSAATGIDGTPNRAIDFPT